MAHTITGHTIINGARNLVLQFNIQSDAASGQYADYELFNLDDYTGADARVSNDFTVKKLSVQTSVGAGVELKFGATGGDHKTFYLTPINTADGSDTFREYDEGGLSSLLANPDRTIRVTSLGLDASGDWISVTLWIKKKFAQQLVA